MEYSNADVVIRTSTYGTLSMYKGHGDDHFYVTVGSGDTICNMLEAFKLNARIYHDDQYLDLVVRECTEYWQNKYNGKKGRRPNVRIEVINDDGIILYTVKP